MVEASPINSAVRELLEAQRRQAEVAGSLQTGGGGGTSGGVTDDWKASVDRQLGQLHDDFRRLVGWLIAAVAAPLLAVVGLYVYTGSKFDAAEARSVAIEAKLSDLRVEQVKLNAKVDRLLERTAPATRP